MVPNSIGFKIYMDQGDDLEPEMWFRVFNTWIPEPDGDVLVDVADYSHVQNGPSTILVGHRANYALDNTGGRFGFLYTRKRDLSGSFANRMTETVREALKAAVRLADDPRLDGGIHFTGEQTQLILNDRLNAPSNRSTHDALTSDVDALLEKLYGGESVETSRDEDTRQRVTLDFVASVSFDPSQMLANIGS